MVGVIGDILVGEAGDVLVPINLHNEELSYVPSEQVEWIPGDDGFTPAGSYVRLLGLPPIKQVGRQFLPFLALTMEGTLIAIARGYPQGFSIELGLPAIKEIIDTTPLGLLDTNNLLHFFDIASVIGEQSNDAIDARDYESRDLNQTTSLNQIKVKNVYSGREITGHNERTYNQDSIALLTEDNQLVVGSAENIAAGKYYPQDSEEIPDKLLGRILVYEDYLIVYSFAGDTISTSLNLPIDYQVMDAVTPSNLLSYTLDSKGIVRSYREGSEKIIPTPFHPTRLLLHIDILPLVEDDGGNIYALPGLTPWNYPIVIIKPNQYRGRITKSARNKARSSSRTIV